MTSENPIMIIVFGLPGTGKTTFATELARELKIVHFNTDMIRHKLGKTGQYDVQTKSLIYEEMLRLTESELKKGNSVIVDGTFYKKSLREQYEELANNYAAEVKRIEMHATEAIVLERLSEERRYSEADQMVYQIITGEFEAEEKPVLALYSDQQEIKEMVAEALAFIRK